MKLFSILDKKAGSYSAPHTYHNKGLALRAFEELANDEKTTVNRYPADFSIWQIGEFDEQIGRLKPLDKPEFVDEAINVIKKKDA